MRTSLTHPARSIALAVIWILTGALAADRCHAQATDTRFVRANAPAGGNGTSWATAFNSLATALTTAQGNPGIKKIWVAAGTYFPGSTPFPMRNNLTIYGGFAGGETQLSQRNIELNPTILTGQNTVRIVNGGSVNATAVLDGLTLQGGYSTSGAAVQGGSGTFRFCRFIGNLAPSGGGAYNAYEGSPTFLNCDFIDNTQAIGVYGGAVTVIDCTFTGNEALRGGALYAYQGSLQFTDCTFTGNEAVSEAGAVYSYEGSLQFTDCTFTGNEAGSQGGALYSNTGSLQVTNCTFTGNSAGDGGVAWTNSGPSIFKNCTFTNNVAQGSADSASVVRGGPSETFLVGCSLVGNLAAIEGPAVYTYGGTVNVVNSLIAGNSGGIFTYQGSFFIHNSTIADNSAEGVLFVANANSAQLVIRNSVIWGNAITFPPAVVETLSYSCLPQPFPGPGNVSSDPRFINREAGDWRVQYGSPTTDAGDTSALPADVFDLDGDGNTVEPIPLDLAGRSRRDDDSETADTGVGPAPVVDMGAFEYFPDCNGNFILDQIDIANGTSTDLDGNGRPDECEDCNGNKLPDSIDIKTGRSQDCDGDGTPDECEIISEESFPYRYDDGSAEYSIGNNTIGDFIWLSPFEVSPGGEILRSVDVAFGSGAPAGAQATLHVWSDPNNDSNPDDAVRRLSIPVTIVAPGTSQFTTVDVPDLSLGGAGDIFFVGLQTTQLPSPAALDIDADSGASWVSAGTYEANADPDDLAAAGKFGLSGTYFNVSGHWLIRAIASRDSDCNGNSILDNCEIADGTAADCDGNGIPDECELQFNDCNGNGIIDRCEVMAGTVGDCNGNGLPDACEIAIGREQDVDRNGVPDSCEDCNGDGVPNGVEIASGLSEDCQPDGIPDSCQIPSEIAGEYSYDDGTRDISIGTSVGNIAWFSNHTIEEGKERIIAVNIMFGQVPAGQPHTVGIWSDPNGDGDPSDAVALSVVSTAAVDPDIDVFTRVAIPPATMAVGTSFFVGAIANGAASSAGMFPAAKDHGPPISKCWAMAHNQPIDPQFPAGEGVYVTRLDDLPPILIGTWCLRAVADSTADCNFNGQPDDCDIAEGISFDQNGNGLPDECEPCVIDLDGDGSVGAGDLAIVLGNWGTSSESADVNGDGIVNGTDLSIVLGSWGPCR